jgi:hypothetical protein
MKNLKKVSQGKKNRASGKRFERKVEESLEKAGWIVMRFAKQVDLVQSKLINPKPHYNPFTKSISYAGTGFPDFICIRSNNIGIKIEADDKEKAQNMKFNYKILGTPGFIVQFVECKCNGILSKVEKEKIEWIKNNLYIPILIASKGEKRGEIIYDEQ